MNKKRLLSGALLLIAMGGIVYLFAPFSRPKDVSRHVNASVFNVSRFLVTDSLRKRLMAGIDKLGNDGFVIGGTRFISGRRFQNGMEFDIKDGHDQFPSKLLVFPDGVNSVLLSWTIGQAGTNPVTVSLTRANRMQRNMGLLLESLSRFIENPDSVYGFHITRPPVSDDSLLITTRRNFEEKPGTDQIYALLDTVLLFARRHTMNQGKTPMMNLSEDGGIFRLMVAWPVDRKGTDSANMIFKQLIPHLFLRAEVTGGTQRVTEAIHAMDLYMIDNKLTAVALPFAYLNTDRRKEPDSAKWKTTLYYPCY